MISKHATNAAIPYTTCHIIGLKSKATFALRLLPCAMTNISPFTWPTTAFLANITLNPFQIYNFTATRNLALLALGLTSISPILGSIALFFAFTTAL